MKKAVALTFSLVMLCVFGFWLVVLPEQSLIDRIENSLDQETLCLKTVGLKKGLFYTFSIEKVMLMKRGGPMRNESATTGSLNALAVGDAPLAVFDDIHCGIDLKSLFMLKPQIRFHGILQGGTVVGEVGLRDNGSMRMTLDAIPVKGIPALESIDIRGEGDLSGTLSFSNDKGEARFSVSPARLKNASIGGAFLPLEIFSDIKGAVTFGKGTISIQSLTLQGDGVYARVKGNAVGRQLNMEIEVMMDSSFQSAPILQTMIGQYQVSPGYFVIPLRTTLPN